jgi:hypothetical protein
VPAIATSPVYEPAVSVGSVYRFGHAYEIKDASGMRDVLHANVVLLDPSGRSIKGQKRVVLQLLTLPGYRNFSNSSNRYFLLPRESGDLVVWPFQTTVVLPFDPAHGGKSIASEEAIIFTVRKGAIVKIAFVR